MCRRRDSSYHVGWQQIESLFQEALQCPAEERDAFLRQACDGDTNLLREVQSLAANHREGNSSQQWGRAAAQLICHVYGSLYYDAGAHPQPERRLLALFGFITSRAEDVRRLTKEILYEP